MNKEYNEFVRKSDEDCHIRFGKSLQEVLSIPKKKKTEEEKEFIDYYKHFLPVIDSDCVMNKICKYIESVDFHIRQKVRSSQSFDYKILLSDNFAVNKKLYEEICRKVNETFKGWKSKKETHQGYTVKNPLMGNQFDKDKEYLGLLRDLEDITSNSESLANHLVYLFYVDKPSYNKNILWSLVGDIIYENVKRKTNAYYFPMKNPNGSLEFLFENYSIERVAVPHDTEAEEEEETDD